MTIESLIIILGIITFGVILGALLIYFLKTISQQEKRVVQALNLTFFKIKKGFEEKPEFSENFYNFLHSFGENWFKTFEHGRSLIVFEMAKRENFGARTPNVKTEINEGRESYFGESDIEFYLACQRKEKKFILDNFLKFWPDFELIETEAPNFFTPREKGQGLEVSLEKPFVLPIKTYTPSEDLFNRVFEIFQRSRGKVIMQILLKPTFYSLKEIKPPSHAVKQKAEKPSFDLNIGFLSPGRDLTDAKLNLVALEKLFEEVRDKNYNNIYNNLKVKTPGDLNEFIFNFVFRVFDPSKNVILNSEELATIFHL
ncbi:MAG: hypothetical protein COV69_03950 [Parcubacteria group bacterium CG11_big_fil_rev_8_21_14_0_20_39_14]|nr:MAG: hypothetical protein COV69_03950 [Parcubacteria group bacterium CG11_big_fil_rev_8_21_14_0_20_39_14]PIS35753.1 MAG: hypothetical protein COT36_00805 [Parcubacteria group bacterium CG08_land_8_20_14_0_20_38_56]